MFLIALAFSNSIYF